MSARELTRVEVLARVKTGALSVQSAAVVLHVGYRQAKRLARRYRAQGPKDCGMAMRDDGRTTRGRRRSATGSSR